MKFSAAAVLAIAAGATAQQTPGSNVTYTTEIVESYVTYCPGPTEISHGGKTYTITEATTLTITDCPCTVTKPLTTTSAVVCHSCTAEVPVKPSVPAGPGYNGTTIATKPATTGKTSNPTAPAGTGEVPGSSATPTGEAPSSVPTAGAGKLAALSGAGLAGIVGLAAFAL